MRVRTVAREEKRLQDRESTADVSYVFLL